MVLSYIAVCIVVSFCMFPGIGYMVSRDIRRRSSSVLYSGVVRGLSHPGVLAHLCLYPRLRFVSAPVPTSICLYIHLHLSLSQS